MKTSNIPNTAEYAQKHYQLDLLLDRAKSHNRTSWTDLSESSGIYVVYWPHDEQLKFLDNPGMAQFANSIAPESLDTKWKKIINREATDILYIGKGKSIRKRVRDLCRFGVGKVPNHRGGEWIWQVSNISSAKLMTQPSPMDREEEFENWLLEKFFEEHSDWPIGNRRGPKGTYRWSPP